MNFLLKKKSEIFAVATLGVLIIIFLGTFFSPHRSVAAFCKVYSTESSLIQNTEDSGDLVRLKDMSQALDKLERVSPEDIDPAVKEADSALKTMINDPSQVFAVLLNVTAQMNKVDSWTSLHCGK